MNVDLVGIGHSVNGCNEEQMLSLQDYLVMAEKIIRHVAPKLRAGLADEMLKSEDAISNVATKLMIADGKWNGKGNIGGFRVERGMFAIRDYMTRDVAAKKNGQQYSFSHPIKGSDGAGETEFGETLEDEEAKTSLDKLVENEDKELLNRLLGSGIVSIDEEYCIRGHYLDYKTHICLGAELGVSKQRVHQLINQGILNLRRMVNGNP
jgi:hypothetical protein